MKMQKLTLGMVLFSLWLSVGVVPRVAAQEPSYSDDGHEVVIRRGGNGETYYEYSINGQVKEIRVVPKNGKPYYLVPKDGGYIKMDRSQILYPSWVIFSW